MSTRVASAGGVLAVGTYDGNVAVYDIRSRSAEPLITSAGSPGKHLDPVWQVCAMQPVFRADSVDQLG